MDATSGLFCGEGHLPLVRHAALPLRRADNRRRRSRGGQVRLRDEGDAPARGAAGDAAVHRRFLGEAGRARRKRSTRDLVANDVRLTMGGEPTFVSIDDLDAPEWNTGAVGGQKEPRAEDLVNRLQQAVRAGRVPAFRPGQVVSRREPAALGLFALLAQGRRADVVGPVADRHRDRRKGRTKKREAVAVEIAERLGLSREFVHAGLRGRQLLAGARGRAAGQRRSARPQDRRSRGAVAAAARVRARARSADRLCAADPALERRSRQARLAQRTLAAATRQALSGAGRLAAGAAAADEEPALGAAERIFRKSIRSTP